MIHEEIKTAFLSGLRADGRELAEEYRPLVGAAAKIATALIREHFEGKDVSEARRHLAAGLERLKTIGILDASTRLRQAVFDVLAKVLTGIC